MEGLSQALWLGGGTGDTGMHKEFKVPVVPEQSFPAGTSCVIRLHQLKTCFQGEKEASGCRSGWKSKLYSSHGNLNTTGRGCSNKPTFARSKKVTAFTRTAQINIPESVRL